MHCIIVGFAQNVVATVAKHLFHYPDIKGMPEKHLAANISPYLIDAPNIIIGKRSQQISTEAEMTKGSQPSDGGHLLLSTEEKQQLIAAEPLADGYIRPFLGADEFINGKQRWCIWLHGVSDTRRNHDLKQMPLVAERIEKVRAVREASRYATSIGSDKRPYEFERVRQPASGRYLIIPRVSSESRRFVPIDYVSFETINSDANFSLPNATLYHFGLLCSTMHNAFMRTVAGRLKSDYRYSNTVVYNNFPFPQADEKARAAIESAAQAVLDAREQYRAEARAENLPEPTLADFYRAGAGYTALDKAHAALDKAVDAAYGYKGGKDDASRVAFLFDLYQQLAAPTDVPAPPGSKRRTRKNTASHGSEE